MSPLLRLWKNAWHASASRRAPVKRRPQTRFRPRLETLEDRLAPATHVWNGFNSDSWSDPGNWSQGGSPYGDHDALLVFPASNVRSLNSVNDGPFTHLSGIRFERAGYTVSGGFVELADRISSTNTGTNTVAFQSFNFDGTAAEPGFYPAAGGTLDVKSYIYQTVNTQPLHKGSAGTLILSAQNTFTSGVRLEAGTLVVGPVNALGSGTLFLDGGTLDGGSRDAGLDNRFIVTRSSTVTSSFQNRRDDSPFILRGDCQILQGQTLSVVTTGALLFEGILFGPGGLSKSGAGRMELFGDSPNTYEGGTVLREGELWVANDEALGQGSLVLNGGDLVSDGVRATVPNRFDVRGSVVIRPGQISNDPNAGFTLSGPGTIRDGATLMVVGPTGTFGPFTFNFSGPLSGPGGLTMDGSLPVILSGTAANTSTGTTTVKSGTLVLRKTAGVNAISGPLVIGDGVGGPATAVVSLAAANQIADTVPVTIRSDGVLKMNNFSDKFGAVTGTGKVMTGDPPTMTVAFDDITATFEGEIEGPGTVVKEGTGTWILSGTNTYEGGTIVADGTLLVDGSIVGPVTVEAGATLGGMGSTGEVTLRPGAAFSPGGDAPGIQAVQDLALSAGSSFVVQLDGSDPGTGYDQLVVTGSVSLNDATLDASLGFSPEPGERFVIIQNDGTDPVSGTFAGLPQGASLWIGGVPFHIYYDGGDGNDVVLVRNVPPAVTVPGDQTAFQNVDLAVGGIRVADPEDANLTVTLQVSHGTLTLGTVAGLTVGGNGTSSVSLSGSLAALNAALAGLLYRGTLNYSGPDTLTVTASDGLESTSAGVAIRVKSLAEQAADLQAQVNALRAAGVLNQGQANSLDVKLDLRNNDGDIGRVQAFLNEVDALLGAGILSPAQADLLRGAGNILLTGLQRR
jgi:autotransporter-associated beta strand protein